MKPFLSKLFWFVCGCCTWGIVFGAVGAIGYDLFVSVSCRNTAKQAHVEYRVTQAWECLLKQADGTWKEIP